MLFLVGFFLWLSLSQAHENDARIAAGEPPVEGTPREAEKTWVLAGPRLHRDADHGDRHDRAGGVEPGLPGAPIEEPANPARTPNPSKAPWYFLGLQEMLVYFDPWLAGVVFPSLIIVGL